MSTATDRRNRAAFQATKLADAEAAADAARTGERYRRRLEAAERVATVEALIADGATLSAEALADYAADLEESQSGKNAPIRRTPLFARMTDRDVVNLAAHAARRALAVERRAGWTVSKDRRADILPDLAAELAGHIMALSDTAEPPRWERAPEPTGKGARAAYAAAPARSRARWHAALLPMARALVWPIRCEDDGRVMPTAQEAREQRSGATYDAAADALSTLAERLADADRPLTPRERTGALAALTPDLSGRERAEREGRTPAGQRVAESKGRAALAERWGNPAALLADLRAATAVERDRAEQNARDQLGEDADRAADLWAAAEYLKRTAAIMRVRPERRVSQRYAPTADRRADRYAMPLTGEHGTGRIAPDDVITAAIERQSVKRTLNGYGVALWPSSAQRATRVEDYAATAEQNARAIAQARAEREANDSRIAERRARVWGHPMPGHADHGV